MRYIMWNMNEVKKIDYKAGYVYHIIFDDGAEGDIDFKEYIDKGVEFKPF
ncbi:MAG: hypothetical protein SV062_01225 [Thermodesulfobacteriota bacterium]|nr:hypothetical protein [Thermodesulfobacteriota bacterium]